MKLLFLAALFYAGLAAGQVVDPHSAVDLIAQVNSLAGACHYDCTIRIPAGEYTVASGTILIHSNTLSLLGDGRNNTIIHYAGANFLDSRLDAAHYGPSFMGSGTIGGFTVYCTDPRVRCITSGSVIGQRWQDLTLVGPGGLAEAPPPGADAEGFTFQNTLNWMERTVFRDITIGGFNTNFHFKAPKPGGTTSFGYMLFDGIWSNQSAHSRNFVVDDGAAVYNVLGFSMQFNAQKTAAEDRVFDVSGAFMGVGFHVTGENSGAPLTFAHIGCGGRMNFEGDFNIFGGAIVTDCPRNAKFAWTPFRVGTQTGLMGIVGGIRGEAPIEGATDLGQIPPQTLQLYPYNIYGPENPYTNAYTGFVANPAGRASPFSVYDPDVPWCVATRNIYAPPNAVADKLCLNGAGDLAVAGTLRGSSVRTTRGTPASAHEACAAGESWDDDNFHYHCTSTGQIKRLALSTF